MKRLGACLGIVEMVLCCAAADNPVFRYFDDISTNQPAPTGFVLRVRAPVPGFPADAAGLRVSDVLVGLDGLRVRNARDFSLLRMFDTARPDMTLTIARTGTLQNIVIPATRTIRRGFFETDEVRPDFARELDAARIDLRPFTQPAWARLTTNAATSLEGATDLAEHPPTTEAMLSLQALPGRIQDSLLTLAARNAPADRSWVTAFLGAFHLMTEQKWADALARMRDSNLETTCPDPFLKSVVIFYQRIAAHPPRPGTTLAADTYGVDIPFFVLCYPVPLCGEDTRSFGDDPPFQAAFDQAFGGDHSGSHTLSETAYRYAGSALSDENPLPAADRYLAQVKAAILDENNHGGWPFRSWLVFERPGRAQVVAALKQRLAGQPTDATITALALVAPAVMDNNADDLRKAYQVIARAGPRELWMADRILKGACAFWSESDRDALVQALHEVDGQQPLPDYYRCLAERSPLFRYRTAHAACVNSTGLCSLPTRLCWQEPLVVMKALQLPAPERTPDDVEDALLSSDTAVAERALAQLEAEMIFCPGDDPLDALVALARKPAAGKVVDALTYVLCYRANLNVRDALTMRDIRTRIFNEVERNSYARVAAEVARLSAEDPKLADKLRDIHTRYGVPSICVLISAKLRAAGRQELSDEYARKVIDFYDAAACAWVERTIDRLAYREFVSQPGFSKWTKRLVKNSGFMGISDCGPICSAIADSYQDRTDAVVDHLVRSCDQNLARDPFTYIYNGRLYPSAAQVRTAILDSLIDRQALSDDQIERLRECQAPEIQAALKRAVAHDDP